MGGARASFDAAFGPPLGETPGKLVVYRKGAEYHVGFTPDPARARLIGILSAGNDTTLSSLIAVQRAHALFPVDAAPRTRGPQAAGAAVVERYASGALASVLADAGHPGDFLAAYARNPTGAIARTVISTGDNPDAALQNAEH